jgi:RNA polymerase sigma-70 factor, ECF subfamily
MGSLVTTIDDEVVDALRAGDERAFVDLVDRYSPAMFAVARTHVANREVAEDVVQDTWLALLKGIDGFQGRSSLRTWLFRVLVNIAKTRGVRDKRTTPVDLAGMEGPTVSPDRFRPAGDRWPGHWVRFPQPWTESPEHSLLSAEALELVRRELALLPVLRRLVVGMRDIDGYDSNEVCVCFSTSPRRTSACCCTVAGRESARRSPATSRPAHDPATEPLGRRRLRQHRLPRVRRGGHRLPRGWPRRCHTSRL